ncbi:unnamed protein product [Amoebophrya sp. A120]|nr:unnamed protein product [Amoebophrya sp. A120]|eukprot:GSA120T00009940001.1
MRTLTYPSLLAASEAIRVLPKQPQEAPTKAFLASSNSKESHIPKNATDTTGFHYTDCINDELLVNGDKTGNPLAYSEASHPISVIRYDKEVPKPKQEAMTHDVCFKFCKDQEYMQYFGLVRGNECYCSPYFVQAAGSSQDCNMACEGNAGEMCGGQTKASVFEMHGCTPPPVMSADIVQSFFATAEDLKSDLDTALDTAKDLITAGKKLADAQGKVGNKIAVQHHQETMASQNFIAGKIKNMPFDSLKDYDLLKVKTGKYQQSAAKAGAQELVEMTRGLNATAQKVLFDTWSIEKVAESVFPKEKSLAKGLGALTHYTSAAVVEGTEDPADASCDGTVIMPISAVVDGAEGCAALCRKTLAPNTCVGFQTYNGYLDAKAGEVMCLLFSEIKSAVKYTGTDCGTAASARCMIPISSEPLRKSLTDSMDTISACMAKKEEHDHHLYHHARETPPETVRPDQTHRGRVHRQPVQLLRPGQCAHPEGQARPLPGPRGHVG